MPTGRLVMKAFLESTELIDWKNDGVLSLAAKLRSRSSNELSCAQITFQWVRDQVQHSLDHCRSEVTCRASEVLDLRTGVCYAKSHLLAALLRASGIAAGFCYQRLSVDGGGHPFCLHGLNAVYLPQQGWYRVDARGNKEGVNAQFTPPVEQLAFPVGDGEFDFQEIWPQPLPIVVQSLQEASSAQSLENCLPDLTPAEMEEICKASKVQPVIHRSELEG